MVSFFSHKVICIRTLLGDSFCQPLTFEMDAVVFVKTLIFPPRPKDGSVPLLSSNQMFSRRRITDVTFQALAVPRESGMRT